MKTIKDVADIKPLERQLTVHEVEEINMKLKWFQIIGLDDMMLNALWEDDHLSKDELRLIKTLVQQMCPFLEPTEPMENALMTGGVV